MMKLFFPELIEELVRLEFWQGMGNIISRRISPIIHYATSVLCLLGRFSVANTYIHILDEKLAFNFKNFNTSGV